MDVHKLKQRHNTQKQSHNERASYSY